MATEKNPEKAAEAGNEQVQKAVDEETENGLRGVEVDQTDNSAYTVEGVTSNPQGVPEAQADPVAARRAAVNPELGRGN
jgi:hypothetical protein